MDKLVKEFKRFVNRIFGNNPYNLAPFAQIVNVDQDENRYGIDHPESFTGILHQEQTGWVNYPISTINITEKVTTRLIGDKPRYLSSGIAPEPPRIIYSLSNGGIVGNTGIIYHIKSRLAISETIHNWILPPRYHPALLAPRFPSPKFLKGVTLSLVTLSAEGFFHFFHELLPKVFLVRSFLDIVDNILINTEAGHWQKAWLENAGIPTNKVIWISGLSHYHCQQIIFPSNPVSDVQPNEWSIAALKELFGVNVINNSGNRWIWASRSDASSRQLLWEKKLIDSFPKFEFICFSKLSPSEAIKLCSECEVFAGPHGAAFSNLVFCPPGTSVIEFLPIGTDKPEYRRLAQICGLRNATAVVDFEATENFEPVLDVLSDFLNLRYRQKTS